MKAPRCRLCTHEHWGPCAFFRSKGMTELKDVKPLPKPTRARVTAGPRRGAKGTPPKPDAVTPLASSAAPRRAPSEPAKFDKVAYQREYMRNRRAEAKAKLAKKAKKARK